MNYFTKIEKAVRREYRNDAAALRVEQLARLSRMVAIYNPTVPSEIESCRKTGKPVRTEVTLFPDGAPAHQVRQYAEGPFSTLGDFVTMSVSIKDPDGLKTARRMVTHGTEVPGAGRFFAAKDGNHIDDDKAAMIGVKDPGVDFISSLGLVSHIDNSERQFNRRAKFLKRMLSHHNIGYWFGKTSAVNGNIFTVTMESGEDVKVLVRECQNGVDGRPMDDGIAFATVSGIEMLTRGADGSRGLECLPGEGFQYTAIHAQADKGHLMIVPDFAYNGQPFEADLCLIGNRKFLKAAAGNFSFGLLNKLKRRKQLYTDLQSVINFKLTPFIYPWALKQDAKYRHMLETGASVGSYLNMINDTSAVAWQDDSFLPTQILRMAQKHNLPLATHLIPRCFKREASMLEQKYRDMAMMDAKGSIRIEIPEEDGICLYNAVDPSALDECFTLVEGAGVLAKGECYAAGNEGASFWHRQPNALGEVVNLDMTTHSYFAGQQESPFVFIATDTIGLVLEIMGGGDQDDAFVGYYSPYLVDHFRTLEQKSLSVKAESAPVSPFNNHGACPFFTNGHFISMMIRKHEEKMTLGGVVKRLMLWAYLKSIDQLGSIYDLTSLNDRLEEVIDAFVKDLSNMDWLLAETRLFDLSLKGQALPVWFRGKSHEAKIEQLEAAGVTWFVSPLDVELAKIRSLVEIQPKYVAQRMNSIVLGDWAQDGGNHILGQWLRDIPDFAATHPASLLASEVKAMILRDRKANQANLALWLMDGLLTEEYVADIEAGSEGIPVHPQFGRPFRSAEERTRFETIAGDKLVVRLANLVMQRDVSFKYQNREFIEQAWFDMMRDIYFGKARHYDRIEDAKDIPDSVLWAQDTMSLTARSLVWARDNQPGMLPNEQETAFFSDDKAPVVHMADDIVTVDMAAVPALQIPADADLQVSGITQLIIVNGAWHHGISLSQFESWKSKLDDQIVEVKAATWKGTPAADVYLNGNFKGKVSADHVADFYAAGGGKTLQGIVSRLDGYKMLVSIC